MSRDIWSPWRQRTGCWWAEPSRIDVPLGHSCCAPRWRLAAQLIRVVPRRPGDGLGVPVRNPSRGSITFRGNSRRAQPARPVELREVWRAGRIAYRERNHRGGGYLLLSLRNRGRDPTSRCRANQGGRPLSCQLYCAGTTRTSPKIRASGSAESHGPRGTSRSALSTTTTARAFQPGLAISLDAWVDECLAKFGRS